MSEEEAATATEVSEEEVYVDDGSGLNSSVILYGFLADMLVIAPVIVYMALDDVDGNAKYHQTYINMLCAAYMPLSITWLTVVFNDGAATRAALKGTVEMAGMGPFALLWVGYLSFMMAATVDNKLKADENILFVIVYGVGNLALLAVHWLIAPGIINWVNTAPLPPVPVAEPVDEEYDEDEEEGDDE